MIRALAQVVAIGLLAGCSQPASGPAIHTIIETGLPSAAPTNPLERRLQHMPRASWDYRRSAFEKDLLAARLYLKVDPATMDERGNLRDPKKIASWTIRLRDGRMAMTAYSSKTRLTLAFPGQRIAYIAMSGRNVLALAKEQPLALNAGTEPYIIIDPEAARGILDRAH